MKFVLKKATTTWTNQPDVDDVIDVLVTKKKFIKWVDRCTGKLEGNSALFKIYGK